MISLDAMDAFAAELEKLSAKIAPIKGAKGRRDKDGVARFSKPLPEPKGMVPKAPSIRKRQY